MTPGCMYLLYCIITLSFAAAQLHVVMQYCDGGLPAPALD